jgi:hypothetical protein
MAGSIKRLDTDLLAGNATRRIDLVYRHLRRDEVGLRERGEWAGSGVQIAEYDIVCPSRSYRRHHRSGGEY